MDVWLGSNYRNHENTEKMLPIIRNDIFTYSEQLSGFLLKIAGTAVSVILAFGPDPLPVPGGHLNQRLQGAKAAGAE